MKIYTDYTCRYIKFSMIFYSEKLLILFSILGTIPNYLSTVKGSIISIEKVTHEKSILKQIFLKARIK